MRMSAQEEYGVRCLIVVARRAPAGGPALASIRDVAEAEGLSLDYAAKLLRVLRQGSLLDSERGAAGGYRLARPAREIPLSLVLQVLDTPLFGPEFCGAHAGQLGSCVHSGGCALRPIWTAIDSAVSSVLTRYTLADLLGPEPVVAPQPQGSHP
jgi:Rrf2 family protein